MASPTKQVANKSGPELTEWPEWMDAKQVGAALGVHAWLVRIWAREGKLPHQRYGPQTIRFHRSDVEAFRRAHFVGSGVSAR